jgi:short-subunit dehydrogenase
MSYSESNDSQIDDMNKYFHNRLILITGATSGIGKSLALLLNQLGAKVILHGRSLRRIQEVMKSGDEKNFQYIIADFETEAGWCIVEQSISNHAPDVLILNAGYNCGKKFSSEWTDEEIYNMLKVNMIAPIRLARTFTGLPKRQESRRLVLILSTSCFFTRKQMSLYVAAKMGLMGFGKVLQKEMRELGVWTSLVYPGRTNTSFRETDHPEYISPNSVAMAIVSLLCLPEDLVPYEFVFRPQCDTDI